MPLLWLPVAGALLWRGWVKGGVPFVQLPGLLAIGILAWQLIEYSIHRWAAAVYYCFGLCFG